MFQLLSGLVRSTTTCNRLNKASASCTAQIANKGAMCSQWFLFHRPIWAYLGFVTMPVYVLMCVYICWWLCFGSHLLKDDNLSSVCMRISMCTEGRKVCACEGERERKWKETCHPRRDFQRTIMVILVAIWALQNARDGLSAITRARLQGERRRWRENSHQFEQPSQSVAVDFKGQSLLFSSMVQAYSLKRTDQEKKNITPSLLPALNFTSSTLTQSMCTLFGYSGACCLNVTTRILDACCIRNSASSSPLLPPFLSILLRFPRVSFNASYIGSLSLWITCQPCLPGHLDREREVTVGDMLHPSVPLSSLRTHWWGTNSPHFLKVLYFCI